MSKKRKDRKLSHWLKVKLTEPAPFEFQDQEAMANGEPQRLVGEVIAEHVAKEAMKGERWAIELAYDRTEGKPIQAVKDDASDRSVEERIEDVTVHHLNELARKCGVVDAGSELDAGALGVGAVESGDADHVGDDGEADPGDDSPGTIPGLLDLPRDGDHDSENDQGES